MTLGLACSVILIGLGTNLVLGAVFFFVAGHYSRTLRSLMDANREMMRNVWAQAAAREPSAPLAGSLAHAAASAGPRDDPMPSAMAQRAILEEEALLNSI